MLFKQRFLDGIGAGEVTLAFRCWRRPTVKAGGTLLTPVGLLAIESVDEISPTALSAAWANQAGFASLAELKEDLATQRNGTLYRIRFSLAGPDPRIALRTQDQLADDEYRHLVKRLDRLDQKASTGPWTRKLLQLIEQFPESRAADLASQSGFEKEWLKTNVRKLKNLGLTESLHPGYRLSPRGNSFLRRDS